MKRTRRGVNCGSRNGRLMPVGSPFGPRSVWVMNLSLPSPVVPSNARPEKPPSRIFWPAAVVPMAGQIGPFIGGRGVRRLAVILVAQRQQAVHRGALDVDLGDGIVLLQRHVGRARVFGDGDVFGLEILRGARAGAVDANALRAQLGFLAVELLERNRAHIAVAAAASNL